MGHDICHGGYTLHPGRIPPSPLPAIPTIASWWGSHNTITFIAPGRLGDRLTAQAQEIARLRAQGFPGIYDVRVSDQGGGARSPEFPAAASRQIDGKHFEE